MSQVTLKTALSNLEHPSLPVTTTTIYQSYSVKDVLELIEGNEDFTEEGQRLEFNVYKFLDTFLLPLDTPLLTARISWGMIERFYLPRFTQFSNKHNLPSIPDKSVALVWADFKQGIKFLIVATDKSVTITETETGISYKARECFAEVTVGDDATRIENVALYLDQVLNSFKLVRYEAETDKNGKPVNQFQHSFAVPAFNDFGKANLDKNWGELVSQQLECKIDYFSETPTYSHRPLLRQLLVPYIERGIPIFPFIVKVNAIEEPNNSLSWAYKLSVSFPKVYDEMGVKVWDNYQQSLLDISEVNTLLYPTPNKFPDHSPILPAIEKGKPFYIVFTEPLTDRDGTVKPKSTPRHRVFSEDAFSRLPSASLIFPKFDAQALADYSPDSVEPQLMLEAAIVPRGQDSSTPSANDLDDIPF